MWNLSDIDVTTSADATENPGKCVEISMKPFSSKASSLATKKSETSAKKASRTLATAIKFKKAPGAPLRFKSAFIFFSTRKHKEIRSQLGKAGEKEKTTNVAKMVSEAWKTLPRPEREYWEEIARKDKERYEIEKSLYRGPWKVPVEKPSKDPSAPKRPMSAFLSFSNSKRSEMKRQYPSKNNAEISRMLAKLWKDASDDEKKAFMEHEVQQREAYKEALTEWKSNAQQRHDHKMQEQKGDLDQQITSDFLSRQEDSTSRPSPALYHAFSENMRSSSEKNLTPYGAITPQFPLPGGGPNPFFVPSDPNTFIPYFGLPSQQMALNFPNFNPLPMGESCTVNDPSFGLMSHLPTDGMDDEMTSAMNSFNSDSLQHSNRSSLLNNGGGGYDFRDDFVDLFD